MGFLEEPLFWAAAVGLGYYWYTSQPQDEMSIQFEPVQSETQSGIQSVTMIYSKNCPACEYMLKKVLVNGNMTNAGFQRNGNKWIRDNGQILELLEIESKAGDRLFDELSKQYKLDGIPAFIISDANGRVTNADMGVKEWDEFIGLF